MTSRGTIIIVITIFTLIPIISKWHVRGGALSVIKAQLSGGRGWGGLGLLLASWAKEGVQSLAHLRELGRTRNQRQAKRSLCSFTKPCSIHPNRGTGTECTEDADRLWELPLLKRLTVD